MAGRLWIDMIFVAMGGAAGAAARHCAALGLQRWTPGFPWNTLLVNIVGCFAMGLLLGLGFTSRPNRVQLGLGTGFIGALTTMSAFSLETVAMVERGERGLALVYVMATVALSLLAITAGAMVARATWPAPT